MDAIASGVVYLTEDRKGLGLYLDMSVRDNINTMVLKRDAWFRSIVDFKKSNARARHSIKSLSIRTPSEATWVGSLSGGNQQNNSPLAPLADPAPGHHTRRADERRRHWGQIRDLSRYRRACSRWDRDHLYLLRIARDHRRRRARSGHERQPKSLGSWIQAQVSRPRRKRSWRSLRRRSMIPPRESHDPTPQDASKGRERAALDGRSLHAVRAGFSGGLRTLGMLPVLILLCIVFQLPLERGCLRRCGARRGRAAPTVAGRAGSRRRAAPGLAQPQRDPVSGAQRAAARATAARVHRGCRWLLC